MKRLILAAMTVAALTVGTKAEAALAFQLTLCQGAACTTFPVDTQVLNANIGDYHINAALGSGNEGNPVSTSSNVDLTVTRVGQTSVAPLNVWLTVTGYTQPTGQQYSFDVALGASETSTGSSPSRGLVTYQAWYSSTNGTGFPPPGSSPSGLASCTPVMSPLTDSCNSNPTAVVVTPGSNLFSITSLTQFFIGLGDTSTYGAVGQASLAAPVPEPGSMVLLGSGLFGMAAILRRRHARK